MQRLCLIKLLVIIISVTTSESGQINLRCDSWDKGPSDYEGEGELYGAYCTITGLRVAEAQSVVLDAKRWAEPCQGVNFVKFYDSSLLYIPQTIFDGFTELRNLDVSSSGIVEIPRNTFSFASSLSWLNASYNDIRRISGAVFLGAFKLRDLDLSHNQIDGLNEYSFNGLKNLVNIDLSSNQLLNIERNIFSDNMLIESVDFSNNKIDSISPPVFRHLERLASVDLSKNSLTQLDPDTFKYAHSISFVGLSSNMLTGLHLNLWESVKYIYADVNQLTSFYLNCTGFLLEEFGPSQCASLKWLRLSNNSLTNLSNITSLPNLRQLVLSNNVIGKLNISTFSQLKYLELLKLRNCNLSGLTFGTFRSQSNLKYLDISQNSLQHLNLDIFLPYMYRHLEEFYLGSNNLSEIAGRHTFAAFSSLKKLGLDKNNFNCSYLAHLISLPTTESVVEFVSDGDVANRENIHGIECMDRQRPIEISTDLMVTSRTQLNESDMKRLKMHERHLEQHLLLMRIFVVLIAIMCLCAIIFKVTHIVTRKRGSWINTISYQSTSTIRSEVEVP